MALCVSASLSAQAPGDTAPAFTLKTLDGDSVSLSDFRGHPVMINFWGTWCPPCRDEIPLIVDAYQAHHDAGLMVLAVDGRDQETSTRAVRRLRRGISDALSRPAGRKGELYAKRYGLRGLPTTVFVGADGVVRAVNIGPLSAAALQQHLGEILPPP